MKKKDYNKRFWAVTILAIVITAAFPASFLMVGLRGDSQALLGIGSILMLFSVIAIPVIWIFFFPRVRRRNKLYNTVILREGLSVAELTALTGRRSNFLIKDLQVLISTGYLKEYRFDDTMKHFYKFINLSEIKKKASQQSKTESMKCEGCGALVAVSDGAGQCSFCGRYLHK